MADRNQNDPQDPADVHTMPCEEWEAQLVDALDGTLLPAESAAFAAHADSCAACNELLTRAKQGQEWLKFLSPPAVSPDLLGKILARTSGATAATLGSSIAVLPVLPVAPFWTRVASPMQRVAQPRILMTTAMAFFSIALTLNLAGIRLTAVRASDLKPSQLRTNLSRQFINSKVGVENYCYRLRIVYEMEATVRELKRSSEAEEGQPAVQQQQTPTTTPKGSAHKGGKSENPRSSEPRASLWGQTVEAGLRGDEVTAAAPIRTQPMEAEASPANQPLREFNNPGNQAGTTPKSCAPLYTERAEGSLA